MRAGSNGSGDDVILLLCRAQGVAAGVLPGVQGTIRVFPERCGSDRAVSWNHEQSKRESISATAAAWSAKKQDIATLLHLGAIQWTGSRRRPVDRRRMQRHRFTAWLEPHISTCVGDCMCIVLRFWCSSVRTRLVSDAGCTRWTHLGRGPHCWPMGLELSGMLPVPRRGNRDSRCGVGLYCARRLSAMAVGQKRHSPAGRVRIRGICAATGFTACVISSSTACLISSRATSTSISFVFSSATFSATCFTTCFTNRA